MKKTAAILLSSILMLLSIAAPAAGKPQVKNSGYRRQGIVDAKYGTDERAKLLEKAYSIAKTLDSQIFGQRVATAALQDRAIQYLESFPNRTGEPVMINFVGLPGIGKSAMLTALEKMGFKVVTLDSQQFVFSGGAVSSPDSLETQLYRAAIHKGVELFDDNGKPDHPVFVVIEEIDKAAERAGDNVPERTNPLIGALNRISSEGVMYLHGRTHSASNILFITTMNFSPNEIEFFIEKVLKRKISYYNLTLEDLAQFDQQLREQDSARYLVLSRIFRSNTTGRLAANTVVLSPLTLKDYQQIAAQQTKRAIEHSVGQSGAEKRAEIEIDSSYLDFLIRETVYPPSGARETVLRANSLTEQLINFALKATGKNLIRVDRPRKVRIGFNPKTGKATLRIREQIVRASGSGNALEDGAALTVNVDYQKAARIFLVPVQVTTAKPTIPARASTAAERPVAKYETFKLRFPNNGAVKANLKAALSANLFGVDEAIELIATDLDKYMSRPRPAKKEPSARTLIGFPGNGKSALFVQAAEFLGIPIVRINMQKYSSDSQETVDGFLLDLQSGVDEARELASRKNDFRYLVLFEELDKVFEINPKGEVVNRPIIAVIKDLLNDGYVDVVNEESERNRIDIRGGFLAMTMNFAIDRFGFEADPRLTTIEDIIRTGKLLSATPAAVRGIMGEMFLPDTVSRLMSSLHVIRPPDRAAHQKIIGQQATVALEARTLDGDERDVGKIELKQTPAYRRHVLSESVIPSEGARNTAKDANSIIAEDLQYALANIPRSSIYAHEPLILTLDFSEARSVVRYRVALRDDPSADVLVLEPRTVALRFPSLKVRGRMAGRRLWVAAHEFGHAYNAVKLGIRIEHAVAVSPSPRAGGYVKYRPRGSSAIDLVADLYSTLGSRAFERMVFSDNPNNGRSVQKVTSGPISDIKEATMLLYNMLYELGMNPDGGTIDRNFMVNGTKYANYNAMPSELAEKLGLIIREIEDQIIRDSLAEHPIEWYAEKIATFARAGAMNEMEFYQLLGFKHPGEWPMFDPTEGPNRSLPENFAADNEIFRRLFAKHIQPIKATERAAAVQVQGLDGLTPRQRLENATEYFAMVVAKHLGPNSQRRPVRQRSSARSCQGVFQ